MSNLRKKLLFILVALVMTLVVVSCTSDTIRVIVIEGEEQMLVGDVQTLTAVVRPISFDQAVTWESSNDSVATVEEDGTVIAVGVGTVTIIATANADTSFTSKFKIKVDYPELADLTLVGLASMTIFTQQQLMVLYHPEFAVKDVTWESSDPEVLTVSDVGLVNGLKEGKATVTVRSVLKPEVFAEMEITVVVIKRSIEYQLNGGQNHVDNPSTYSVVSDEITLKDPTREKHTFLGWYLTSNFSGEKVTAVSPSQDKDIVLYAKWEKIIVDYTITYVLNGGELVGTVPTKFTELVSVTLPTPTQEGFNFIGWYNNAGFTGTKVTSIPVGTESNQTFYAKWEEIIVVTEYSITFVLNGGTFDEGVIVPSKYDVGVGLASLPNVTKEGYNFLGWYIGEDKVTSIASDSIGDITLSAKFELIPLDKFDIEYDLGGGVWVDTGMKSHDDVKAAFLRDMAVYLKSLGWTGTEITLSEETDKDFMGVSYNYATNIEAFFTTEPTYAPKWGWIFTFIKAKGADTSTTTLLRANIHAFIYLTRWASWPYSTDFTQIKFDDYKSSMPETESQVGPEKYEVGQTIAIPAPQKEGYIFKGWFLNGTLFEGITPLTTGDLLLVAKWQKDYGDLNVIEVGPESVYKTLAAALEVAEEGTIIILAPGNYAGATITVKGITIQGPNADVDPNFGVRTSEALFTSAITVKADDVTINGIALGASIIGNKAASISNLTMKYLVLKSFAGPSPTNAPLMFVPDDNTVTYTNIVLENSRFEKVAERIMIMYGARIVNLSVKDSTFLGTSSTAQYNDGFKLAIAAAGSFDVKGKVEFIGNYFQDYMQYPIWIGYYGVGTFDFFDNTFKDCCLYKDLNEGSISMNNYATTAGEKVIIKIQYNTADNSQIFARLRNAGATAENFEAYVNYNKMFKNINTLYITNQGYNPLNLIDASNNYYDKTPTASFFSGVAIWEPYYQNEDDVPVFGQDLNVFKIEYDLDGGTLPSGAPKNYDSRMGLPTLPIPTKGTMIFLGWFIGDEKVESIEKDTTGKVMLSARWREDALYVGESTEDYYYPTIAAALAVAKAGNKIIVEAGVYSENLTLSLANLTIVGPNMNVNPNTTTRLAEAIITGKITIAKTATNLTINGLAFTDTATITGTQVINFSFLNNHIYDTTKATKAWVEASGYTEGFISFQSTAGQESLNLVFENNKFNRVSNANVNISYVKNVSFNGNVFNNFDRDAIRFDTGGYNYGVLAFTNNEFTQDTLGGNNGIYFRMYGGPGINDTIILIENNRFANIGTVSASVYSGAIGARNYQEKGCEIYIRNNEFEKCLNYIRLRNNGTAANHAQSTWVANISNNIFIGLPATYYFASWTGSDTATTNPIQTYFGENYYEDDNGNVIDDIQTIASKMLNTASKGSPMLEEPSWAKAEEVKFFTISYDLDGGTVSGLIGEYTRLSGEIALPEPTKANHQFTGWYLDDKLVTSISADSRGNLVLVAHWQVLEGEFYDIEYVFDKGSWPTRDAINREEVVDALFTDYYNWAKTYLGYKGTYEAFCKGADGKYQSGYWYVSINGKMRSATTRAVDETGTNDYFYNTPEYYYKWKPFFEAFNVAMLAVNAGQDFFIDTYAAMIRIYQFADWTQPGYYNAYLNSFYKAVQIATEPEITYRAGQEVVLKNLFLSNGLEFLGWYDNPEFDGSPITKILTTDSGNKKFYAKWQPEIEAQEILVSNEITEMARYDTYQLIWAFNPANTTDQRVEFESSNPSVLSVTQKGLLRALANGTAVIRIKSLGIGGVDKKMTIVVYSPDHFEISYETDSFVDINQYIQLNASYPKRDGTFANLVWESLNDDIATVSSTGLVFGVEAGVATIRVFVEGEPDIYLDFVVTVLEDGLSEAIKAVIAANESNIYTNYDLGIGAGVPVYYKDIFGSISKLLYNDPLVIDDKYLAAGNNNTKGNGGLKSSTEFITVHYTGNMASGSSASANANYFVNSDLSIHYVTGNDGVYHALDDNLVAFHAGDGTSVPFTWTKTGVMAQAGDPQWPVFGITLNSKFSINGVETTIAVPEGSTTATQKVTNSRWINDMGLAFKIVDGEYYMGTTWWCYTQILEGRICSKGGNLNSIGIESAVNAGSDLWYTWQKTAQLVAKLMLENDLDITRVVGHHFYSAKDCPQPLLENNLEIWWLFIEMVKQEYDLLTKYQDYQFELICDNKLVDANGRIISQPTFAEVITYTVKVTIGDTVQEVTLSSAINGIYSKGK